MTQKTALPVMLRGWARSNLSGLADHTWVTSYPSPFSCQGAGPPRDYWYCWGECHPAGPRATTRLLTTAVADLAMARCICSPNRRRRVPRDSCHGGINLYGIDGVCHQVANRVLYATATTTTGPCTVEGAHGYELSVLMFGAYGLDIEEWRARRRRCHAKADGYEESVTGSFRTLALSRLGGKLSGERLEGVLELQQGLRREKNAIDERTIGQELTGQEMAKETNALLTNYQDRLARLLGAEDYQELFRVFPEEHVAVVDSQIGATVPYAPAAVYETVIRKRVLRPARRKMRASGSARRSGGKSKRSGRSAGSKKKR